MLPTATVMSPRLLHLRQELEAGTPAALAAFWHDVTAQGSPLIEPDGVSPTHALVTFVWQATTPVENVVVVSEVLNGWWRDRCAGSTLTRLLDTDIYFRTFRVPRDARFLYRLSPNDALIAPDDALDRDARRATFQVDPLNPHTFAEPTDAEDPTHTEPTWSLVELPAAPPQPWIVPQPQGATGQLTLHRFPSRTLHNQRRIWIYTPPLYQPQGEPYPLLLLLDGWCYVHLVPTPVILDNLTAAGAIPPHVAVLIDATPERVHECNGSVAFNAFVTHELLPWVRATYHVTTIPAQTTIGGMSLGAVGATFAALQHPDIFGNVVAQSGAFWNGHPDYLEEEWVARHVATHPWQPLRFAMEAGTFENQRDLPRVTLLRANRHLRTVLQAKGYTIDYTEFSGGHQSLCWRGTFADRLVSVVGGNNDSVH